MTLTQVLNELQVNTDGPGFTPLNNQLNQLVLEAGLNVGVMHLTCLHTSCSLTINENADPRVLKDLAAWMNAMYSGTASTNSAKGAAGYFSVASTPPATRPAAPTVTSTRRARRPSAPRQYDTSRR